MVYVLVSGWGFWAGVWTGDGGGAGGSAGDRDSGGVDILDVVTELSVLVMELSVWGLEDRELFVDVVGTIVSVLFRAAKRPLLSWVIYR